MVVFFSPSAACGGVDNSSCVFSWWVWRYWMLLGCFVMLWNLCIGVEGYLLSCELQLKDREDAKWKEIEQLMDDSVASEFEKLESYPVEGVPLLEACQARQGDLIALKNQIAQEECLNDLESQLCEKNSCPNPGPSYLGLVWELLRVCLNCCNWSKTSIDNSRACRGHADPPVATRHTCMLHFHGFFFSHAIFWQTVWNFAHQDQQCYGWWRTNHGRNSKQESLCCGATDEAQGAWREASELNFCTQRRPTQDTLGGACSSLLLLLHYHNKCKSHVSYSWTCHSMHSGFLLSVVIVLCLLSCSISSVTGKKETSC